VGLDPLLVAGQLFSFSTLMLSVGSLTCKTVSWMIYTVLVETLNPAHSLTVHSVAWWQRSKCLCVLLYELFFMLLVLKAIVLTAKMFYLWNSVLIYCVI